jgi:diacylglycerol kinase
MKHLGAEVVASLSESFLLGRARDMSAIAAMMYALCASGVAGGALLSKSAGGAQL